VTDEPADPNDGPFPIDLGSARLARVENYLAGGEAHFSIDRAAAEAVGDASPLGLDALRGLIKAMKAYMNRVVRFLAADEGIDQYLYLGMTTPSAEMIHQVAWEHQPRARIVYASYDPVTLAHVHELTRDSGEGSATHVQSGFDNPERILGEAREMLDLSRRTVLLLPGSLNLIADDDTAQHIVDTLGGALGPGSYIAFAHTSIELGGRTAAEMFKKLNDAIDESYTSRDRSQIERLLADYDLVDPGLVAIEDWRSEGDAPSLESGRPVPIYGAVGIRR
jgi:hypothetical protein